jgi:hypothetical protein
MSVANATSLADIVSSPIARLTDAFADRQPVFLIILTTTLPGMVVPINRPQLTEDRRGAVALAKAAGPPHHAAAERPRERSS